MFGLAAAPDPKVGLAVAPPAAAEPAAVTDGSVPDVGRVLEPPELTTVADTADEDVDGAAVPEEVHPATAITTTAATDPASKNPRMRMHSP